MSVMSVLSRYCLILFLYFFVLHQYINESIFGNRPFLKFGIYNQLHNNAVVAKSTDIKSSHWNVYHVYTDASHKWYLKSILWYWTCLILYLILMNLSCLFTYKLIYNYLGMILIMISFQLYLCWNWLIRNIYIVLFIIICFAHFSYKCSYSKYLITFSS